MGPCAGTCSHVCNAPTLGCVHITGELDGLLQGAGSPSLLPPAGSAGAWLLPATLASELPWLGTGVGQGHSHRVGFSPPFAPSPQVQFMLTTALRRLSPAGMSLCSLFHIPATCLHPPPPPAPGSQYAQVPLLQEAFPPAPFPFLSLDPRVQTGYVSLRTLSILGCLSCSLPVPINRPRAPEGLGLHQMKLFLSMALVPRVQFWGSPSLPTSLTLQACSPQGVSRRQGMNPHTVPAAASSPQVLTASDPLTAHVTSEVRWGVMEPARALGLSSLGLDPNVQLGDLEQVTLLFWASASTSRR